MFKFLHTLDNIFFIVCLFGHSISTEYEVAAYCDFDLSFFEEYVEHCFMCLLAYLSISFEEIYNVLLFYLIAFLDWIYIDTKDEHLTLCKIK